MQEVLTVLDVPWWRPKKTLSIDVELKRVHSYLPGLSGVQWRSLNRVG